MRKIFKIVLLVDCVLLLTLGFIFFTGCYLGRSNRIVSLIEDGHKIIFKVYNNTDMLFAPDIPVETRYSKRTSINLPNINITVVDIPQDAPNMNNILNLHYSVSLGFLPGVNANVINKALYNGHKTFRRLSIQPGDIDLNKTERENIDFINRILARSDYDGIYISLSDSKALDRYPTLSRKIQNALSFIVVDNTICYKNQICYITPDASEEAIDAILSKVSLMSEVEGKWTIIFSYTEDVDRKVVNAISSISLRDR